MALRALVKADQLAKVADRTSVTQLYRYVCDV